jgi:hypothetical protein
MKIADNLQMILWRCLLMLSAMSLCMSGCSGRQTKEVLLEFKQQPNEKYIYDVADSVEWEFVDVDQKRSTFQHLQNQKSEMVVESLDSAQVRSLTMMFVISKDTVLNPPDFVARRKRKSQVGREFGFVLRMRKNGEILKVVTEDPKVAFDFNRSYKPSQPVFPDRAIAPGYKWAQNFSVEMPHGGKPTIATTEYLLNGFEKIGEFDCAVIDFKGALEYEDSYKPPEDKPAEFLLRKYRSRFTSEGRLFFAHREGLMVKRTNLITSTVLTTTYKKDNTEQQSKSVFKDYELITLTSINRAGHDAITYNIP